MIGRWGNDTALLRAEDGTTLEATVPECLRSRIDVGASVDLMDDGLIDWHVPDDPTRDSAHQES